MSLGELVVHRGTRVEATDDFVGNVDELVVGPDHGYMTHVDLTLTEACQGAERLLEIDGYCKTHR